VVARISTSTVAVALFHCCKSFSDVAFQIPPLDLDLRDTMVARVPASSIVVRFVSTVVVMLFCCCRSIILTSHLNLRSLHVAMVLSGYCREFQLLLQQFYF
jgi:hypothetical protein